MTPSLDWKHDLRQAAGRCYDLGPAVFGDAWSRDPWLRKHVARQSRAYRDDLVALAKAVASNSKHQRPIQRRVLASSAAKFCCLIVAAAKRKMKLTWDDLEQMALGLSPFKECGEAVRVHFEQKSDGTWRPTAKLGVKRLALNYLVRDVLLAIRGRPVTDYNQRGRGTHAAVRLLMSAINNDRPYVWTADIKNFFPSIRQEWVKQRLPLPDRVTTMSVMIPECVHIHVPPGFGDIGSIRDTLRRGLPLGTPTSQLIAGYLLEEVLGPVAFDNFCFWYADNLMGACESESGAVAILQEVRERLVAHHAGELTLHKEEVRFVDEGAHVLGYLITGITNQENWEARAYPSPRKRQEWLADLRLRLAHVAPDDLHDRALDWGEQWLSTWAASDPSSTWMETWFDQVLAVATQMKAAGTHEKPMVLLHPDHDPTHPPWAH